MAGREKQLTFNQIHLTANDSSLAGQVQVTLLDKPEWTVDLKFSQLNLDNLLVQRDPVTKNGEVQQGQSQSTLARPVIASQVDAVSYQGLKGFAADITLQADKVLWRKMAFDNVSAKIDNQFGLLNVAQLQGKVTVGWCRFRARWMPEKDSRERSSIRASTVSKLAQS